VQLPGFSFSTTSGLGLNSAHVSDPSVFFCLISHLLSVCSVIQCRTNTRLSWSVTMQHSLVLHCPLLTVKSMPSWMILLPPTNYVDRIKTGKRFVPLASIQCICFYISLGFKVKFASLWTDRLYVFLSSVCKLYLMSVTFLVL